MTKKAKKKGNPKIADAGVKTRFRKGESGNPGGRPQTRTFSEAIRAVSELSVRELRTLKSDSVSIAVAKSLMRSALKGKVSAISEAIDRSEGKARQGIENKSDVKQIVEVVYEQTEYKNPPPDKTLFEQLTEIVKNSTNEELMQGAADLALLLKKEGENYGKP